MSASSPRPVESTHPTPASARYGADDIADALGRHRPTPDQRRVIEAPLRNALVIAGAGSGKTETMAARVVWLVANGLVDPGEVLGLTFTRKAATELGHRLGVRLRTLRRRGLGTAAPAEVEAAGESEGTEEIPTVSTYHGYAGSLVGEHGLLLGLEPDLRVLSEASAWQLAHDVVHGWTGPMDAFGGAASTAVGAVVGLAGEVSEHLREAGEVRSWLRATRDHLAGLPKGTSRVRSLTEIDYLGGLEQVMAMVEAYRDAKAARGSLDFGDQVAIAARLARDVPRVAAQERARYRVVLLDEFQDTSEAQLVLLAALFGPGAAEAGGPPVSVTAVGDPHQAIYGWRGASAGALERFPRRFADPGPSGDPADRTTADVHSLALSFRNHAPVLRAANVLAGPLRERTLVPVDPLEPLPGADGGVVEVARVGTQPEEVELVAGWVEERRGGAGEPGDPPSVAVLCRTRAQIQPIVTALRERGIPVQVVGLGGLLGTPLVRDLVAALGVAEDPTRGPDVMRLLTGTVCRLGAADLDGLYGWLEHRRREESPPEGSAAPLDPSETLQLGEVLDHLPAPGWRDSRGRGLGDTAIARVRGLAGALRRIRSLSAAPLVDVVRIAEQALGLDVEAAAEPTSDPAWSRADLDAFAEVGAAYARSADRAGLGAFVAWLDAAEERERGLDRPDLPAAGVSGNAVQVLTVHAAKGLEWDAVAVPGLTERTFPSHRGGGSPRLGEDGELHLGTRLTSRGWLGGYASLPYPLRGDRDSLPTLDLRGCADWADVRAAVGSFVEAGGEHTVQEERRLAYVALTRARTHLLLSAHLWAEGAARPRVTSRFLHEVRALGPAVRERAWSPAPEEPAEAENPLSDLAHAPPWPPDRGAQQDRYRDAVAAVLADPVLAPGAGPLGLAEAADLIGVDPDPGQDGGALAGLTRDVADLLREAAGRAERRADLARVVPRHLSTSDVVALAADRDRVVDQWRRPMPQPPARAARLGTSFHAWVERHYQRAALLEPEEIELLDSAPAADDALGVDAETEALEAMRAHFLDSPWADREPRAIEVPVETHLGGRIVRGRVDAVFEDEEALGGTPGGLVVVDWKSGRPPTGDAARVRALQLAAYRVAYARLVGVPVTRVRGAFFHAQAGRTDWPDLPGEEELAGLLRELLPG